MGRVKGTHLKRMAKELVTKHAKLFSDDYEKNKLKINELKIVGGSKTERNKLAGEVSVLMRRARKAKEAEEKAA
ncbi:30S ribosomal protein S17e [Candidatus Micrarchaeota archaeon]|nr:30S ribosomal protein S17e [Candidatus Micrarchaeota archaeon]